MITHYDLLRVRSDATTEQIKKAYRTAVRQTHPDMTGEDNSTLSTLLTDAYAVLLDENKRAIYDRTLTSSQPTPNSSPSDATYSQTKNTQFTDETPSWAQESYSEPVFSPQGSSSPFDPDEYNRFQQNLQAEKKTRGNTFEPTVKPSTSSQRKNILHENKVSSHWLLKVMSKNAFVLFTLAVFLYFFPLVVAVIGDNAVDMEALSIAAVLGGIGVFAHLVLLLPAARSRLIYKRRLIIFILFQIVVSLLWFVLRPSLGFISLGETALILGAVLGIRQRDITSRNS